MKRNYRSVMSICWIFLGVILILLGVFEILDAFWSGMGSSLLLIGILQLIRNARINKNKEYREKIEIAENDERQKFIRNHSWAWTGYIFLLCMSFAAIIFRIIGQEQISSVCSVGIALLLVIYWITYLIISKKY